MATAISTTPMALAEAIAEARGASKRPALFSMLRGRHEWRRRRRRTFNTWRRSPPWCLGAHRRRGQKRRSEYIADIIDASARASGLAYDAEASSMMGPTRGRGALYNQGPRRRMEAFPPEEGSKIHFSAGKNGHAAAAGLLLNPLLTEEFAR